MNMTSTGCTRTLQIGACRIKIILKSHKGLTSLTHAFHPRVIITTPQQKSLRTKSHFWIQLCHKGKRSNSTSILDVGTWHFKPSETFQYTHFTSCHPLGVKKGFIKGEALSLLRTNSSKENFQNRLEEFQKHLTKRGYPQNLITLTLSEIHFENRKELHSNKNLQEEKPFCPLSRNINHHFAIYRAIN